MSSLSPEIVGPHHAIELGEQLASLLRAGLPQNFLIDFANVRSLGSSAFAEIVAFAQEVGRLPVCNMQQNLRLGAALIGLEDYTEFADDRRAGINLARKAAIRSQEETVDYPASRLDDSD